MPHKFTRCCSPMDYDTHLKLNQMAWKQHHFLGFMLSNCSIVYLFFHSMHRLDTAKTIGSQLQFCCSLFGWKPRLTSFLAFVCVFTFCSFIVVNKSNGISANCAKVFTRNDLIIREKWVVLWFICTFDSRSLSFSVSLFLVGKFAYGRRPTNQPANQTDLNRKFRLIFLFNTHKHNVRSQCTMWFVQNFIILNFSSFTHSHSHSLCLALSLTRSKSLAQMFNNTKIKRKKNTFFFLLLLPLVVQLKLLNNTI